MTKIAEMMDWAARQCSVYNIIGMVSSRSETAMQLKDFLNETAEELLDRIDLPSPITLDVPITGTGVASYNLPSDFLRLTRDDMCVYEQTRNRRACVPVSSNGLWSHLVSLGASGSERYYRITGDDVAGFKIEFYRPLEVGSIIVVSYITKNWARTSASVPIAAWNKYDDVLQLPLVLVRLGVIWRFKAKKGMAYSDLQTDYEIRLSRAINDARGIRKVDMGETDSDGGPTKFVIPDIVNY